MLLLVGDTKNVYKGETEKGIEQRIRRMREENIEWKREMEDSVEEWTSAKAVMETEKRCKERKEE